MFQIARFFVVVLVVAAMATAAQARPNYGGQCSYCHGSSDTADAALVGAEDDVFTVDPGQAIGLGFLVTPDPAAGMGQYYRLALRGLDLLNAPLPEAGEPFAAYGMPRQYTPDSSGAWASSEGDQFIYWFGQFYVAPRQFSPVPTPFNYNVVVGADVAGGDYPLTLSGGGGFPSAVPGGHLAGGWSFNKDFTLRVTPEPSSLVLMGLGLFGLCLTVRRRRQTAG